MAIDLAQLLDDFSLTDHREHVLRVARNTVEIANDTPRQLCDRLAR